MKLTTSRLKTLIKEELEKLNEVDKAPISNAFLDGYYNTLVLNGPKEALRQFRQRSVNEEGLFTNKSFKRGTRTARMSDGSTFSKPGNPNDVIRRVATRLVMDTTIDSRFGNEPNNPFYFQFREMKKFKIDLRVYVRDDENKSSGTAAGNTTNESRIGIECKYQNFNAQGEQAAMQLGQNLAKQVLKFEQLLAQKYEGKQEASDIPTEEDIIKLASQAYGTSFELF